MTNVFESSKSEMRRLRFQEKEYNNFVNCYYCHSSVEYKNIHKVSLQNKGKTGGTLLLVCATCHSKIYNR